MQFLIDLFTNSMIMIPICAWMLAQIIKVIINAAVTHEFDIQRLFGDGGMPSGHSATVMSFAVIAGWSCGFDSLQFAFAGIFASIVMHDAMGVRREAGKQATSIKQLAEIVNSMFLDKDQAVRTEKLKEFVGHTPLQVVFGALLGIIVAIVYLVIARVQYGVI